MEEDWSLVECFFKVIDVSMETIYQRYTNGKAESVIEKLMPIFQITMYVQENMQE